MSNSEIEQSGTVKGHLPNEASLSGRISNGLSLSGHISIGSGAGDFIIKMTLARDDDGNYTFASCDTTVEQIDAAVSAEKRVVLIATDTTSGGFWEMPLVQAFQGETYIFMAYTFRGYVMSTVYKSGENETWEFVESGISSESVDYYNSTQPDVETVMAALNKLFTNSHTHANKAVLDKFAETDGKPIYNGEALGGGAGDFIIKMTVEVNGDNYTVTSCDKTMEQIDAAVASGQNIKAIAFDKFIMPMTQIMEYGESYTFGAFLGPSLVVANVAKNTESGTDDWQFYSISLAADIVEYSNAVMPRISTVSEALDALVPKSHSHDNKDTLDKLSVTDGKLQYNGSDVGLKPVKGTDYWTSADKTEIVNDTLAALPTWTGGSY